MMTRPRSRAGASSRRRSRHPPACPARAGDALGSLFYLRIKEHCISVCYGHGFRYNINPMVSADKPWLVTPIAPHLRETRYRCLKGCKAPEAGIEENWQRVARTAAGQADAAHGAHCCDLEREGE